MKKKNWTWVIIIFIFLLLLIFGRYYFSYLKNNNEITDEMIGKCPSGYTYAKGGLQGDSAPYYCVEQTTIEGKRPNIIPMSPYPTK